MKYFYAKEDRKGIRGGAWVHCKGMLKGYNRDAANGLYAVYDWQFENRRERTPFNPDFSMLNYSAYLPVVDIISHVFTVGWIICSERTAKIFEEYRLPLHFVYDATLHAKTTSKSSIREQLPYKIISFPWPDERDFTFIDYERTTPYWYQRRWNLKKHEDYYECVKLGMVDEGQKIGMREDLPSTEEYTNMENQVLAEELWVKNDEIIDLFYRPTYAISAPTGIAFYVVSERLKDRLVAEGITGWKFEECPQIHLSPGEYVYTKNKTGK